MINNDSEFKAALAEADALLDQAAGEDSAQHTRLMTLLAELAGYRPHIVAGGEAGVAAERAKLAEHLDSFEDRVKPHYGSHWASLVGGDLR